MKKIQFILSLLVLGLSMNLSFAQQYTPDASASAIKFSIKNMGITFNGTFGGLAGQITFNPNDLSSSFFNVHVEAKSVNTDNESRDNHLRKEDFFNVEKFPKLSFASDKITSAGKGEYTVTGRLTIKDVTKTISFKFSATPQGNGIILKGNFEINRRDYNVGGSSMTLSDKVKVNLIVVGN